MLSLLYLGSKVGLGRRRLLAGWEQFCVSKGGLVRMVIHDWLRFAAQNPLGHVLRSGVVHAHHRLDLEGRMPAKAVMELCDARRKDGLGAPLASITIGNCVAGPLGLEGIQTFRLERNWQKPLRSVRPCGRK